MKLAPNTYRAMAWFMIAMCCFNAGMAIWWLCSGELKLALGRTALALFSLLAAFLNDFAARRT